MTKIASDLYPTHICITKQFDEILMFSYYICDFAGLCRDHNALRGYPDVTSPLTAKLFNCNFAHLKLCLADAIHNFKWVKTIQI